MVFNLVFFTITITMKTFSGEKLERAYRAERTEHLVSKNKECYIVKRMI